MKMNELDESIKQDVAEDTPDQKSLRMQYPHYYKNKDAGTVFRTQNADGQRMDITPDDEEWDDYYKQQFPDMPTPDDAENGFYSDDNTGAYVEETKGVAEGRRGYDDLRDTGFGRPERDMSDESNLLYIYKDGRVKQRMVSNTVEREARAEGFRDTPEQALKMHGIIKSKFKPGKWVQKQGDSWSEVFPFGNSKDVTESASAGATSSANIATVVNPDQAHSKKPVKSVNALDQDEVSLFGAPMETVKNTAGKKAAIIKRR
jgi:hypothetical protein